MKISDIHSARRFKFRLNFESIPKTTYSIDGLIRIFRTNKATEFYVEPFGQSHEILSADKPTADCIDDLLQSEEQKIFHCLFVIEGVNSKSIEIQAYTFRSMTEYKTPIVIKVAQTVLEKNTLQQLEKMFVWEGLGQPTIFSLRYKDSAKKKADIRLLSDKCFLFAHNTARGLIASKVSYAKDKTDLPIDIYLAPAVEFIEETDDGGINDTFSHDIEQISKAATYFARWEAYNMLAENQLKKEADEFGEVSYNDVKKITGMNGTRCEFTINEGVEISSEYCDAELAVLLGNEVNKDSKVYSRAEKIRIGKFKKISKNILVTYQDDYGMSTPIPPQGKLVLSTSGNETVIRRRNVAKDRMLGGRSPIKSIVRLIEEGISEFSLESNWGDNKAVTDELRRNFKKANDLNPRQREALELAINTPDIALIQGPPGTGKTTVIKAICERFREIYEGKQRQAQKLDPDYVTQRPKILISSFQNVAVDNAISKPLPGDLPAFRIGRKVAEQFQKSLDEWVSGVKNSLENDASNTVALAFADQKRKLSDEFFAYKKSGESIDHAICIIKKYLSFAEIPYPTELKHRASAIVQEYQKRGRLVDDVSDPIISKLKAQRLNREAFADDGADNARRLVAHLKNRDDINIQQDDMNSISTIFSGEKISDITFEKYVEVVKKLQAIYCSEVKKNDPTDKAKIEKCILQLAHAFSNGYLSMTDDLETKKSLIIGEFLDRFEYEYEELVAKYSLTTAATCQTSLQLSNGCDDIYDLVIIDEAARATPLDLFIPMSMGRKIILVGDHKQLPHMLEPDVLKLILEDPKFKDLPGIDISLFERLYNMFSQGTRPKTILLDTQYRMHPEICRFVSHAFYDDKLHSGITEADRVISKELFEGKALAFINVSSVSHGIELPGVSKARPAEVKAITDDVKRIIAVEPESTIGVITFYSAQEALLKDSMKSVLNDDQLSRVEIGTVDAFQGKEFDFTLLSCVRSNGIKDNEQHSVGFLVKPNRICVALSRARKQLSVYADAETMKQVSWFNILYDKCKNMREGYYREY